MLVSSSSCLEFLFNKDVHELRDASMADFKETRRYSKAAYLGIVEGY